MTRTGWRAALSLAATFALGAAVGGAILGWADRGSHTEHGRPTPAAVADRLGGELDLTPAQRDSVRRIIERARPAMDSLWGECRPRIEQLKRAVNTEIATQLTAEQRRKFAELVAERERRWRGWLRGDSGAQGAR